MGTKMLACFQFFCTFLTNKCSFTLSTLFQQPSLASKLQIAAIRKLFFFNICLFKKSIYIDKWLVGLLTTPWWGCTVMVCIADLNLFCNLAKMSSPMTYHLTSLRYSQILWMFSSPVELKHLMDHWQFNNRQICKWSKHANLTDPITRTSSSSTPTSPGHNLQITTSIESFELVEFRTYAARSLLLPFWILSVD